MSRLFTSLAVLVALVAAAYRFYVQPMQLVLGSGRVLESLGKTDCKTVPALTACEKLVLHAPTGVLYLACSTPESRVAWVPAVGQLNASGHENKDYIATYDPSTGAVVRLQPTFPGFGSHGMDVVPSSSNPSELFIYAVNHRRPTDAAHVEANSTIEIFKTSVGSKTLTHLRTVYDPSVIWTPNDVIGAADGRSFFFTNDHTWKTGPREILSLLGIEAGSVGYCHVDEGCKIAYPRLQGANGIARASPSNDTIFVGHAKFRDIRVFERQADNTLRKTHTIPMDRPVDNLSVDKDGAVWAAAFPFPLRIIEHIANPSVLSPTSAHAIVQNTGLDAFYGERYRVEKRFEDDGTLASGTTSVVHDAERGLLFLHGIAAPHLTVCKL
ncbi:hypothetical protein FB45DRAFT_894654 [Roridomyces roridus]|uniref:Serum paraoxonase/arylesterase n=1 Tax=Roridomyces roridus TaxID=1738132 RepID=A0AAD7G110_9AGAR|nr:hypothetical protein FB45DRAFT_894654 [Roridomyces roridus]